MENNRLDDFFKNKLNEPDTSEENWGSLGQDVFERSRAHFPKRKSAFVRFKPQAWAAVLVLGLMTTVGFAYQLSVRLNETRQQQALLEENLDKLQQQKQELEEVVAVQQSNIQALEHKNSSLKEEIDAIETIQKRNNQQQILLLNQKENTINDYQEKLLSESIIKKQLLESIENKNQLIIAQKSGASDTKEPVANYSLSSLNGLSISDLSNATILPPWEVLYELPTIDPKKNKIRFEVSLHTGLLGMSVDKDFEWNERDIASKHSGTERFLSNLKEVKFGVSTNGKWWFNVGILSSNIYGESSVKFNTPYDKNGEFTRNDGSKGNNISLRSTNAFEPVFSSIDIKIDEEYDLEDEERLYGEVNSFEDYHLIQVPFGVTYLQGSNKLKWAFHGGMNWNKLELIDYDLDLEIESEEYEIDVLDIESDWEKYDSKQFIGMYAGVGINYEITPRLSAKADAYFRYDQVFLNNDIKIGLGYKF